MITFGKYNLLLTLLLCFAALYADVEQKSKDPEILDLVVILSTGCEEILKVDHVTHEPCCNELFAACKDDQIVIVSPSILYGILKRKRNGQDGISECLDKIMCHYSSYLNRDEDFVILVPTNNTKSLKDLGFQDSQLTRIEPDALMQFSAIRWASHLIEIEHFRKLFREAESGYEAPVKHIYLISHGIDALDEIKDFKWSTPLLASLTVWQFVNFLQMLNAINTQFLHIASCYAAGSNFFNVERILSGVAEDERCINAHVPINFPIMIQGTTDSSVSAVIGNGSGCKNFFSAISGWMQHDKDINFLSEGLSKAIYNLKNISVVPNYPVMKLSASCPIISLPVQGVAVIGQDTDIISVGSDERYLFFYPSAMRNTRLVFESLNNLPHCISKVVGRSCHFLGAIQVPQVDERSCVTLLQECFLKEVIRNYDQKCGFGVSDKAWFIKCIISDETDNHAVAKGVIVHKGMLKYGAHKALILYQDAQGIFHRINESLPIFGQSAFHDEIITEHEYMHAAARIFWETKADDQALSYATCGNEQCWHVQESLRDFFRSMDLSAPTIDVHAYVEEDLAQIRNRTLKKEAYINYVGHVHDMQILNELIEACTNNSDAIDFNDIADMLAHFIDTENHSISLRAACELLGKDKVLAKQAAVNTLTYMVEVGLYVHASRACQDVLTCFDALAQKQVLDSYQIGLEQTIRNFFALLIQTMVKEGQLQAANLIMGAMIQHEQWYRYGLGLEVCTQLIKQDVWDMSALPQTRLQWFVDQIKKHLTDEALAVYFAQTHIVDEYQLLVYE